MTRETMGLILKFMSTNYEKFKTGDKVRHINDHEIQGIVLGLVPRLDGRVCIIVETTVPDNLVGIFSPALLELINT